MKTGPAILALSVLTVASILGGETYQADHPAPMKVSVVRKAWRQPVAHAAPSKPELTYEQLTYIGLHPKRSTIDYSPRVAAIKLASLWHIPVKQ